jgi:hypothetical protein
VAQGQWYWCLTHQAVEPYEQCRAEVRLGPYATREDAARALQKVAERNEEWENDPRFNDDDEGDKDSPSPLGG